jgi:hypothetical protein
MFFEADKNANWQSNTSVLRKLYDKGVVMPIDIMAVVRWQTKERNWLNRLFLGRSKEALEAKAALYLLNIQVLPPYYVHPQPNPQGEMGLVKNTLATVRQLSKTRTDFFLGELNYSDDYMEAFFSGSGACGMYPLFTCRRLTELGYNCRVVQQQVNGVRRMALVN